MTMIISGRSLGTENACMTSRFTCTGAGASEAAAAEEVPVGGAPASVIMMADPSASVLSLPFLSIFCLWRMVKRPRRETCNFFSSFRSFFISSFASCSRCQILSASLFDSSSTSSSSSIFLLLASASCSSAFLFATFMSKMTITSLYCSSLSFKACVLAFASRCLRSTSFKALQAKASSAVALATSSVTAWMSKLASWILFTASCSRPSFSLICSSSACSFACMRSKASA
mmetsp:Transcript_35353/g.101521  ORF Transcript_35353/g.101521 Transcript_35353/m.101521 type:complete len:230 (+) Transcript_35353:374-1063(+)